MMHYDDFEQHIREADRYETLEQQSRSLIPTLRFYARFLFEVGHEGLTALFRGPDLERICRGCYRMIRCCEALGGHVTITGLEHLRNLDHAPVLIANHMSMLETITIPCITGCHFPLTYILKKSLLRYPVFGKIIRRMRVVSVTRKNPKQDFRQAMTQGTERLQSGVAVAVFLQQSRSAEFDARKLNTLGLRLARQAKAPVLPLVLRTDFLNNGQHFKDFGLIHPERPIHFEFGKPFYIEDLKQDKQRLVEFIEQRLRAWDVPVCSEEPPPAAAAASSAAAQQ